MRAPVLRVMTVGVTLDQLDQLIASRRGAHPATSYVARLLAGGAPVIARKVGEEAIEAVVAALAETPEKLVSEAADLVFHLAVLLAAAGRSTADVLDELERREGVSGLVEKASRAEG